MFKPLIIILLIQYVYSYSFRQVNTSFQTYNNCTIIISNISCKHGYINSNCICTCDTSYITWPESSNKLCNTYQKNKFTALLLQIFFGIISGVGLFYLNYNLLGCLSLIISLGGCCFIFCVGKMFDNNIKYASFRTLSLCFFTTILTLFGIFGYWIYSIIYISKLNYDNDGVPLS